jgi:hypothetical protein
MPIRTVVLSFVAVVALLISAGLSSGAADERIASLNASHSSASGNLLQRLRSRESSQFAQAGCGLCKNVDCCGGASNGWKLCRSNCSSGYKCMQVAKCP